MKHNILYISGWYPTRLKPTLGNFIFKHAECACKDNNIRAIHVCTDPHMKVDLEREVSTTPFHSTVIYIRQNRIPIIGKIINYFKIIQIYLSEYKKMVTDGFTPDLVHANIAYPIGIVALLYKWKFQINYVIEEHWTGYLPYSAYKINFFKKWIIQKGTNNADYLLPDSNDLGRAMQQYGIKTPFISLANVVNTDLFFPKSTTSTSSIINLIHISTIDESHKNISLLLKAFANICKKYPACKLHFVHDGDIRQYASLIDELQIEQNIINHGIKNTEGVAEILRSCDFFVLSSNYENLPCVLVEAISCGVPVISTNVGGVSEIINEENGMMVPPNNLKALTTAIEEMIQKYKTYNKEKMHQSAIKKYSYEAIGNQLTEIYNQCIDNQHVTR